MYKGQQQGKLIYDVRNENGQYSSVVVVSGCEEAQGINLPFTIFSFLSGFL